MPPHAGLAAYRLTALRPLPKSLVGLSGGGVRCLQIEKRGNAPFFLIVRVWSSEFDDYRRDLRTRTIQAIAPKKARARITTPQFPTAGIVVPGRSVVVVVDPGGWVVVVVEVVVVIVVVVGTWHSGALMVF